MTPLYGRSIVCPDDPINIYILGKYTDKKENKIFLVDKEIQKGAVARSHCKKSKNYMPHENASW